MQQNFRPEPADAGRNWPAMTAPTQRLEACVTGTLPYATGIGDTADSPLKTLSTQPATSTSATHRRNRTAWNERAEALARLRPAEHDDAVVVAEDPIARRERHTSEANRDVDLASPILTALAWVCAKRLHGQGQIRKRGDVPNRGVQDEPRPPVLQGEGGDHVPDERAVQGATAVYDEDRSVTGTGQLPPQQTVVVVAANRANPPRKARGASAVLPHLQVTRTHLLAELIGEIRSRNYAFVELLYPCRHGAAVGPGHGVNASLAGSTRPLKSLTSRIAVSQRSMCSGRTAAL